MSSTAPQPEISVSLTPETQASGPVADVLAAEEAAIWAYGLIGGRVSSTQAQSRALLALDTHRAARTWLRGVILASGKVPAVPPAGYEPSEPVIDNASAERFAAQVESALVPLWVQAAGSVQGADRKVAAQYGAGCNARAVLWGAPTQAFPGTSPDETPSAD